MLVHHFLHTDLSNKILKFGTLYVEHPLHSSHVYTYKQESSEFVIVPSNG